MNRHTATISKRKAFPWVKNHKRMLHSRNYRSLSLAHRGVWHGLMLLDEEGDGRLRNQDCQNLAEVLGADVRTLRKAIDELQGRHMIRWDHQDLILNSSYEEKLVTPCKEVADGVQTSGDPPETSGELQQICIKKFSNGAVLNRENDALEQNRTEENDNETKGVVASSEIDPHLRARLGGMGLTLDAAACEEVARASPEALENALLCLGSARNVDNPIGYLLAALRRNFTPPASFVEARDRQTRERASRKASLEEAAERLGTELAQELTPEAIEQEVEALLEADQARRTLVGRPHLEGNALEERRDRLQQEFLRRWQADREQKQRLLANYTAELQSLETALGQGRTIGEAV